MNRRKIALNYLRTWLFIDLVASFPYSWLFDGLFKQEEVTSNESYIYMTPNLLRLLKLFRFMRLLKLVRLAKVSLIIIKIEDFISSYTLSSLIRFFKLVMVIFFIAHWTACIWYYLGNSEMQTHDETWLINDAGLQDKGLLERYVASLYWSFTTVSTVGYGDIVPVTMDEKIYSCFTMILACGVFAFTLASVSSFVDNQTKEADLYRLEIAQMNHFLKIRSIPPLLQAKARRYLEYRWSIRKKRQDNDLEFLKMLSEPLRDEIGMHIQGKILFNYKLFRRFETGFIAGLTKIIKFEFFAPQDIIFAQGEVGEKMYFVNSGNIDLFDTASSTTFNVVRVGGVFGEVGFFLDYLRSLSARANEFSEMITLDKPGFEGVLQRFPEVCIKLREIIKSCKNGNLTSLGIRCFCCKLRGHLAVNCSDLQLGVKGERKC
jgi:hyperpolarization activated cyclic nucleotide-gated potassium channel 2